MTDVISEMPPTLKTIINGKINFFQLMNLNHL